jgi:DNA-binding HxlR family transcriptional regulator
MSGKEPRINGQRPIMALLDLLSQRWALRIIWELRDAARTSRDLRASTAISPTVLQSRLDELRAAGIVEVARGSGYRLTDVGRELTAAFLPLYGFAGRWAGALDDHAPPSDAEPMPAEAGETREAGGMPPTPDVFARRVLRYFYPVHYRFGMEMEHAMGQGRLGRKQAALLWLIYSEADPDGWMPRKDIETKLGAWFEMSPPNVTKIIHDTASAPHRMIEIVESAGSAREKRLRLTEDGRNFVSSMIESANDFLGRRVGHMPQAKLAAGLAFLEEAFGQETNLPV